jgi:hypothetical protein
MKLEAKVWVGGVFGGCVAGDAGGGRIDVVEAACRPEPVAVDEIVGPLREPRQIESGLRLAVSAALECAHLRLLYRRGSPHTTHSGIGALPDQRTLRVR